MTRLGAAAQAYALAQVGTAIRAGQCLLNVRTWFGLGSKYPTATAAWNGAQYRHTNRPPTGAVVPVWFKSANPAGHVALHLADHSVVTVNGTRVSHFASIDAMVSVGYGAYMGWAEDLNGVRVYVAVPTPPPAPVYRDITGIQRAVRANPDNVWGPDTNARVTAVRAASAYGGVKFPYGVAFTQSVVGAKPDGDWGPISKSDHDATVAAIQRAVGVNPDSVWGGITDNAVAAAHAASHHTA